MTQHTLSWCFHTAAPRAGIPRETTVSRTNVLLLCELLNFTGGLRNLDNKITVSTVACSLVLHIFAVMMCSFCCLRLLALAFRLNFSEQLPSKGCLFPDRNYSVTVAAVVLWDLQTALECLYECTGVQRRIQFDAFSVCKLHLSATLATCWQSEVSSLWVLSSSTRVCYLMLPSFYLESQNLERRMMSP